MATINSNSNITRSQIKAAVVKELKLIKAVAPKDPFLISDFFNKSCFQALQPIATNVQGSIFNSLKNTPQNKSGIAIDKVNPNKKNPTEPQNHDGLWKFV